jgi:uncharacterized protein involved in exopolysaccharide biosynthesis
VESQINQAQARLNELTATKRLTEESAELRAARSSLAALQRQKADLERSADDEVQVSPNPMYVEASKRRDDASAAVLVAERQLASLRKNQRSLQDRQKKAPEIRDQAARLASELETAKQDLDLRTKELAQAEARLRDIANERQLSFRVAGAPAAPGRPSGPAPALLALGGLVLGAGAGIALAWTLDAKDRSFRDVETVSEFVGVPSLGAIGRIETPDEAARRRAQTLRTAAFVGAFGLVAAGIAAWAVVAEPSATDTASSGEIVR